MANGKFTYHLSRAFKNPVNASVTIFLIALIFRLVVMMAFAETPYWSHNLVDAELYHQWAAGLAEGSNPNPPPFFYSPFYPYVLSTVYRVFGPSLTAARLIQSLLGAGLCVLVYLLARKLISWQAALVAGLICAFSGVLAFYDNLLLKTSFVTFILFAAVFLLFLDVKKSNLSHLRFIAAGLLFGLASTLRGNVLIVAALLFAFLLFSGIAKKNIFPSLSLAAGLMTAILPLTVSNYLASGDFILTTYSGGFNFYEGNSAEASGYHPSLVGVRQTASFEQADATAAARDALGREPSASEVSDYWFDRALADISADPARWLGLLCFKSALFVNSAEIPDNYNYSFVAAKTGPLAVSPFGFYIIMPLGLAGLGVALGHGGKSRLLALIALAYCASVVIFYVTSRYRAPVYPFLAFFAALAVERLGLWVARRDFQRALVLLVAIFVFFVVASKPLVKPQLGYGREYYALGLMRLEEDDSLGAIDNFMEAREHHPYSALVENNLGAAYLKAATDFSLHRDVYLEIGIVHLERATQLEPRFYSAWKNLGLALAASGKIEVAREALINACRVAPDEDRRYSAMSIINRLGN